MPATKQSATIATKQLLKDSQDKNILKECKINILHSFFVKKIENLFIFLALEEHLL